MGKMLAEMPVNRVLAIQKKKTNALDVPSFWLACLEKS